MKSIKSIPGSLAIIGGLIALSGFIHAQVTTVPVQSNAGSTGQPDSVVQIVADSQGLALIPFDQLPRVGTFWTVGSGGLFPVPYPCPTDGPNAIFYALGPNGVFLVDATDGAAPQLTARQAMLGVTASSLVQAQANALLDLVAQVQGAQASAQLNTTMSASGAMGQMGVPFPGAGGGDSGTNSDGGGASPNGSPVQNYGTNLWIRIDGIASGNAVGIVSNSTADVLYEIQSLTNLNQNNWSSEGFLSGSELTNWTAMSVAANGRSQLYLRIRSWADSTGTGIPDWWWLMYFGQLTNVNANASAAGDGLSNLQKFQMGLNPTNYYNPNGVPGFVGCLDATGTNVILEWSNAPGPVIGYAIQRGVYNSAIGNFIYSPLATVNSNASFFMDVGANYSNAAQSYAYEVTVAYPGGDMSATNTWYFWWYSNYGSYGMPYGPPLPNNVYAYTDPTGTNVIVTWTPAQGWATNYIVERGVFDNITYNYDYYPIASVGTNMTSYEVVGAITNSGNLNDVYGVVAVYPGGGLSMPAASSINSQPSPPTGFSATLDSTGTNVLLSWAAPPGAVTNYIIERGIYNTNTGTYTFSQIGEVNGTFFEDAGAITGVNSYYNAYEIEALYANGTVSPVASYYLSGPPSAPINYANLYLTAYLVRNGTGCWQVMFSGFPTNSAQTIQLTWMDNGGGFVAVQNISTTNLINGIYPIADTNVVNLLGDSLTVQLFGLTGQPGQVAQAGTLTSDAPYFVDGRVHLKQVLFFLLSGALESSTYGGYNGDYTYNWSTNFEETSFLHRDSYYWGGAGGAWIALDNLLPFIMNYGFRNEILDTNNPGPFNFTWQTNFNPNPAPPVLTNVAPYLIWQGLDPNRASEAGVTTWSVQIEEPGPTFIYSNYLSLQGSPFSNCYGLAGLNGEVVYGTTDIPINLDDNLTWITSGSSDYYSRFQAPILTNAGYYFATLINPANDAMGLSSVDAQPLPSPLNNDFAVTNRTPLMVASIGQPIVVGGWAKYSIHNGNPTTPAYLGQYFMTNAFLLNTNGTATTNVAGILSPYGEFFPLQAGQAQLVTMPDIDPPYQQGTSVVQVISLNADANHDGTMDFSYFGPDQTSPSRPFRFWINDDTDSGDYGGDGVPGQGSMADAVRETSQDDYRSFPYYAVHGTRDLVDFFPVYLNISSLVQVLPPNDTVRYVLKQADGAVNFVYTDLTPTNYMNFLRDTNEARSIATNLAMIVTADGYVLDNNFIQSIATQGKGIILVEGRANTTQPLVLEVWQGSSFGSNPAFWQPTNMLAQTKLYLSLSGVEQMFRSKTLLLNSESGTVADRLTDASVPNEPDTTDMNFIFLHGYNVNPDQARGWNADFYKRMYWSGSHAKFWAVTWEAADSQVAGQVTINLQTNIVNAFNAAPPLNDFLNSLSGTNVVAAHSLGNMVVLSALNDYANQNINTYFMIDAAVAIEAIDKNAESNPDMYPTAWTNYNGNLWASDWYVLFPTNDHRSSLTWWGRLANLQNASVYNFYSSGEEVLRDYSSDPPGSLIGIATGQLVSLWEGDTGEYTWAWQEKLKGLMPANFLLSSDHGGWQFNTNYASLTIAQANALQSSQLKTNAFFNWGSPSGSFFPFNNDLALESSSGGNYAQANQNRILSDAIPCLTLPVGANHVDRLAPIGQPDRNFDMQGSYENGWPLGRPTRTAGVSAAGEWHHSDVRAVAYTFTYQLFDQMVTVGNLK